MSDFAEGYAVGQSNNNGMFGGSGEWIWVILLFALFGWGNGGFGNNGGNQMGYDLGKVATTNDVASGFSTSAIMSNQREAALGLQNLQNNINQGFSGLNVQVLTGVNDINSNIANCCCTTQRAIDGVNYNLSKSTCDIIQAINGGVQRIVDLDTARQLREKDMIINAQGRKIENQELFNSLVGTLRPVAQPAYLTCSPFESLFGTRCQTQPINNSCCGL